MAFQLYLRRKERAARKERDAGIQKRIRKLEEEGGEGGDPPLPVAAEIAQEIAEEAKKDK